MFVASYRDSVPAGTRGTEWVRHGFNNNAPEPQLQAPGAPRRTALRKNVSATNILRISTPGSTTSSTSSRFVLPRTASLPQLTLPPTIAPKWPSDVKRDVFRELLAEQDAAAAAAATIGPSEWENAPAVAVSPRTLSRCAERFSQYVDAHALVAAESASEGLPSFELHLNSVPSPLTKSRAYQDQIAQQARTRAEEWAEKQLDTLREIWEKAEEEEGGRCAGERVALAGDGAA